MFLWTGTGSAHLKVLALGLVEGGGVACGTGAEVVLGGCEPVDDCRAPCDCKLFGSVSSSYSYRVGEGEESLWCWGV